MDEEVRYFSLSSSELIGSLQKLMKLVTGLMVWFSEPFFSCFLFLCSFSRGLGFKMCSVPGLKHFLALKGYILLYFLVLNTGFI